MNKINDLARLLEAMYEARGQGQGVGGPRQGDGGANKCVCPKCGYSTSHKRGVPCTSLKCPNCGAKLVGK